MEAGRGLVTAIEWTGKHVPLVVADAARRAMTRLRNEWKCMIIKEGELGKGR